MPKLLSLYSLVSLFILLNAFFLVDESYSFFYKPYCIYLFILAAPGSMQVLSSPTREQTHDPCTGRTET